MRKLLIAGIVLFAILIYFQAYPPEKGFNFTFKKSSGGYSATLQNPQSVSILDPSVPWPVYHEEPGFVIYKEDESLQNYLFVVDPQQKQISVSNYFAKMNDYKEVQGQWNRAENPICVLNAGFFDSEGSPSLPIIDNFQIIPGTKTDNYDVRILYIDNGVLTLDDIGSDSDVRSAPFAISGLRPDFPNRITVTNRTVLGVKNNLLYISITGDRAIESLDESAENTLLKFYSQLQIPEESIVVLDGGGSTMVRCFGEDLKASERTIGSTLIISSK